MEAAELGALAAAHDAVAGLAGTLDEPLDPREVLRVDERRERRLRLARIARDVLIDRRVEALEEIAGDVRVHEEPGARQAHLAAVVVHLGRAGGRVVQVGVAEDQEWALAAELAREGHEVGGCSLADRARGLRRPGERDAPRQRVRDESRSDVLADSLDDVEDSRRNPASAVRSARSEQESGDHSAGFRTTVHPAASAGAVFQVESMNGAFQGVMITAGPEGMRITVLWVPFESQTRSS